MNPQHTFLLEPTQIADVSTIEFGRFNKMQIYDFPSNYDPKVASETDREIIETCGAVIYVLDIQMDVSPQAIQQFLGIFKTFSVINPKIHFSVFIHKTDLETFMLEEKRNDALKAVRDKISEELESINIPATKKIDYHVTSIFEASLWESMSKVVQQLWTKMRDFSDKGI